MGYKSTMESLYASDNSFLVRKGIKRLWEEYFYEVIQRISWFWLKITLYVEYLQRPKGPNNKYRNEKDISLMK